MKENMTISNLPEEDALFEQIMKEFASMPENESAVEMTSDDFSLDELHQLLGEEPQETEQVSVQEPEQIFVEEPQQPEQILTEEPQEPRAEEPVFEVPEAEEPVMEEPVADSEPERQEPDETPSPPQQAPEAKLQTAQQPKPKKRKRRTPYQRNRRQQGIWVSWLLVGSIVIFMVLGLLMPDREFSNSENRKLAEIPKLSFSALADGSYFSGWNDYLADQFPGRDFWISVNLWMNKLTGQTLTNGVYLCDDGYLMQVPSEPDKENLDKNVDAINAFSKKFNTLDIYMSVVPNAFTIYADKLPNNAPVRDQVDDLKSLAARLSDTEFIDVTQTLMDHQAQQLFYKTDHHWTTLGAFYAFQEIAPAMGITPPGADGYSAYVVSNTFQGTLSSKTGSHSAKDTVEIYIPKTNIDYYVTYPEAQGNICSMYNREALDQKDHYAVFFGGNYSRVDITTTANTERNLLIFKDSYANCFVQFLYPYFDHIIMIDPRYYYDNLDTVITSQSITDVLYLYNADTFLSDSSLADVLATG